LHNPARARPESFYIGVQNNIYGGAGRSCLVWIEW